MPNFPYYFSDLPEDFNLLSLRHYLLLAYWVYFRPTTLKYYLNQIDNEFYHANSGLKFLRLLHKYKYRNICFAMMGASLLISVILNLPVLILISWITSENINWLGWASGSTTGVVLGAIMFSIFFVLYGLLVNIARCMAASIVVGMSNSVILGASFGIVVGLDEKFQFISTENALLVSGVAAVIVGIWISIQKGLLKGIILSGVVGIISFFSYGLLHKEITLLSTTITSNHFLIISSLIVGIIVSIAIGGIAGIAVGIIIGVITGFIISIIFNLLSSNGDIQQTVLLFNLAVGIASSGTVGAAVSNARGVVDGLIICVLLGIAARLQQDSSSIGLLTITIGSVFALRIHFYLVECAIAIYGWLKQANHPSQWDELLIFPLPGTRSNIVKQLKLNEAQGLRLIANLACNPFQAWIAQQALKSYIHKHVSPLHCLYTILTMEIGNAYVAAPVSKEDWKQLATVKNLLLSELNGTRIDCTLDLTSSLIERFIYRLTFYLRNHQKTSITNFAGMLHELLNRKVINSEDFDLSSYHHIYANLTDYSGGYEIEHSFSLMAKFLSYKEIIELAEDNETLEYISTENAIRPEVIIALIHLQAIKKDIYKYFNAIIWSNKQAALLRALENINNLELYIKHEVLVPEKHILNRINKQWRNLVSEEAGKAGRGELYNPIPNPYVVGNPVTGELFVGREDIMQRLKEIWDKPGQCSSIVLYGHRRMGKSSILQNLANYFQSIPTEFLSKTIFVDFNMQLVGDVNNTGELLFLLAEEIYYSLEELSSKLNKPQEENFTAHHPYNAFKRFLNQVDKVRDGRKFIITIDEFEIIEEMLETNKLQPQLIGFWRGIFYTYEWFIMAFAGLHTLEEMNRNYWNPFFDSVQPILVSFISPNAARQLIENAIPVEYTPEAVNEIIYLTNCQPFLVQLICSALVTRFNRQVFEKGMIKRKKLTKQDVEAVIKSEELFRNGLAYFNGVWTQAMKSKPDGQIEILHHLCRKRMSEIELAEVTNFSLENIQSALKTLQRHDVIKKEGEQYAYTIELMRRWVKKQS